MAKYHSANRTLTEILHEALNFLLAAVIIVPIFKYLGFAAVLCYLTAGLLIGPESQSDY